MPCIRGALYVVLQGLEAVARVWAHHTRNMSLIDLRHSLHSHCLIERQQWHAWSEQSIHSTVCDARALLSEDLVQAVQDKSGSCEIPGGFTAARF